MRHGQFLAVAFLDLDQFKKVNDGWGHDAGDAVLGTAAERMRKCLRSQDALIRWGGEEFLIVLPNTDHDGARRMVARVAEHGLGPRPDGTPQTASIGIAELKHDRMTDSGRARGRSRSPNVPRQIGRPKPGCRLHRGDHALCRRGRIGSDYRGRFGPRRDRVTCPRQDERRLAADEPRFFHLATVFGLMP
jgi:hypothetical protein